MPKDKIARKRRKPPRRAYSRHQGIPSSQPPPLLSAVSGVFFFEGFGCHGPFSPSASTTCVRAFSLKRDRIRQGRQCKVQREDGVIGSGRSRSRVQSTKMKREIREIVPTPDLIWRGLIGVLGTIGRSFSTLHI